jgi:hypothetical protein
MRSTGALVVLLSLGVTACSKNDDSITAGNSPAGDYTLCGALNATCNSFYGGPAVADEYFTGLPASCVGAATAQCPMLQSGYSDAFKNAVVKCAKTHSPCDATFNNCVGLATASAPPTAVQEKVKADFCATYMAAVDGGTSFIDNICTTFFRVTDQGDGGPSSLDSFSYGQGFIALMVNDTIASQMDQCIATTATQAGDGGAPTCLPCLESLQACARAALKAAVLPAGCTGDGG